MGRRRDARVLAVQFLYQQDIYKNPEATHAGDLQRFWHTTETDEATRGLAQPLIEGVLEKREELDGIIKSHSQNWDLNRMAPIDRNILRLALYEMHHRDDVPPVVAINEGIEIAKKLSTEESGRFVNGLLDKAKADLKRPVREAKGKTAPDAGA
jgi:N utilization substance protein B